MDEFVGGYTFSQKPLWRNRWQATTKKVTAAAAAAMAATAAIFTIIRASVA